MYRMIRLLPILIPVGRRILRNPTVRERLHLKPLDRERRPEGE